jgi:hypothetical protein
MTAIAIVATSPGRARFDDEAEHLADRAAGEAVGRRARGDAVERFAVGVHRQNGTRGLPLERAYAVVRCSARQYARQWGERGERA